MDSQNNTQNFYMTNDDDTLSSGASSISTDDGFHYDNLLDYLNEGGAMMTRGHAMTYHRFNTENFPTLRLSPKMRMAIEDYTNLQDTFMIAHGYGEQVQQYKDGDVLAFNRVDANELLRCVLHMYNGITSGVHIDRLWMIDYEYVDNITLHSIGVVDAAYCLSDRYFNARVNIPFNSQWAKGARLMFQTIIAKYGVRIAKWLMAADYMIMGSRVFYNMYSPNKFWEESRVLQRDESIPSCIYMTQRRWRNGAWKYYDPEFFQMDPEDYLDASESDEEFAPIHSTMYVRRNFRSYANVVSGRASIRDWWHTYWNGADDLKDEAIDAGLAYGLYKESPTLTTAFLLLLQRIHKYFNTTVILKDIMEFARKMIAIIKDGSTAAYNYVSDYFNPTHQTQGAVGTDEVDGRIFGNPSMAPIFSTNGTMLDDTSLQIGNFIAENGEEMSTIVSLFVGIVFVCMATSLGLSSYLKDTSTSFLKKIGNVGLSFSGVARGIDGLINLAGKFNSVVQYCMSYFLGRSENHKLLATVMQCGVEDQDGFEKAKFMDHVKFIIDPKNVHAINASDEHKFIVEKCDEVANKILVAVAANELSLSRESIAWFGHVRGEIKKLRQGIHRYPKVEPQRFVPYWINVSGEPGVGKSVIIGDLSVYLSKCMFAAGPKYAFKSIPEDDIFNKNFADKYMPGYNGQNILTIDDVFQDATVGAVDQSSAIQLINFISSVPYQPVQASIDEKGMPFTSRLVLTSTNSELPNRMEITSQDALLTRIRKMVRVTWKHGVCAACKTSRGVELCSNCIKLADPDLKRPLVFTILKLNTTSGVTQWMQAENLTWSQLKLRILRDFLKYWKHQEDMLARTKTVGVDEASMSVLNEFADIHSTGVVSLLKNGLSSVGDNVMAFTFGRTVKGWEALMRAKEFDRLYNEACCHAKILNWLSIQRGESMEECTYKIGTTVGDRRVAAFQFKLDSEYGNEVNEWLYQFNEQLAAHARMCEFGHDGLDITSVLSSMYSRYILDREMLHIASKDALNTMWEEWRSSIIGSVLGTVVAVFVGLISFKAVKAVKNIVMPSAPQSTNIRYNTGSQRVRPHQLRAAIHSTSMDDELDLVTENLVNSMTQHDAMCRVVIEYNGKRQEANGVRVKGTFVLMNAHHIDGVPEGALMEFIIPGRDGWKTVKQCLDYDRICRFECGREIDALLYHCDNKMPHAKDITRHFLSDEAETTTTPAILYTAGSGDNSITYVYPNIRATPERWHHETYLGSNKRIYSVIGFYRINTEIPRGLSGSVLLARNSRMNRKIIGIQVATSSSKGTSYVQPISEGMLLDAMQGVEIISEPDLAEIHSCCSIKEVGDAPQNLGWDGLKYIGRIPREQQMSMSKKTKYEPSLIFDENKVTQEPSVLSNHDRRMREELRGQSVLFRNLEKFDKPCGFVRTVFLNLVTVWLATWYSIRQKVPGIPGRLLDDFEMVNGREPLMKQFDMRTSPGYPYVKEREIPNGRGKFEWFTEEVLDDGKKVYHMKEKVASRVRHREREAQEGRRVPTIAYACLKDETRPIEKIVEGKTRVFLCMPMDYNLLTRKYFGDFIMMMHARAGIHIPSCVGVDPCMGWTGLARRLKSVGLDAEDFDYGGWDTQIHPQFMDSFVKIVNAWYNDGPVNGRVRATIIQELSHTFFIAQDRLFQKAAGTCSGFALTAECNSIINELIMVYSWAILSMEHDEEKCNMTSYLENCALGVYGDDIVKIVSPEALWFNGNNIKPIIDELGMDITTGSKDGSDFKFMRLEDLTFLKRSFRPVGYDEYTAPLRRDIIENIPQWVHRSDNPSIATNVNVMTAARNYALWGKNEYDRFCNEINLRIADKISEGYVDLAPLYCTWREMMNAIYKDSSMVL